MVFECRICGETQIYNYYCEDCSITRRICLTYGKKEVRNILERVCLRNKKQMTNKIDILKTKLEKEEKKEIATKTVKFEDTKPTGDSTYIQPNNTLNKDYIEELKDKIKNY